MSRAWISDTIRYGIAAVAFLLGIVVWELIGQLLGTSRNPEEIPYEIVDEFPHDPRAFTQGLVYLDGRMFESTGLRGRSTLREIEVGTGKVLKKLRLDAEYFGEGLTYFDEKLYQLTWESKVGFIYDAETLEPIGEFDYKTEGWGLTTDGVYLILSDGSSWLYFMEPETMRVSYRVEVRDSGRPLKGLNELEFIDGEIWANVFQTPRIVRIDPASGRVTGNLDLTEIVEPHAETAEEVLNGIAWDSTNRLLYVTGKLWDTMYVLRVGEDAEPPEEDAAPDDDKASRKEREKVSRKEKEKED